MSFSGRETSEDELSSLFANTCDNADFDALFSHDPHAVEEQEPLTEAALLSLQYPLDDLASDLDVWVSDLLLADSGEGSAIEAPSHSSAVDELLTDVEILQILSGSPAGLVSRTSFAANSLAIGSASPRAMLELPNFGPFADSTTPLPVEIEHDLDSWLEAFSDSAILGLPGAAMDTFGEYDLTMFDYDDNTQSLQEPQDALVSQSDSELFYADDPTLLPAELYDLSASGPLLYGFDAELTAAGFESDFLGPMYQVGNTLPELDCFDTVATGIRPPSSTYYSPKQRAPCTNTPSNPSERNVETEPGWMYADAGIRSVAGGDQRYFYGSDTTTSDDESNHPRAKIDRFNAEKPKHDPSHAWVKHNPNAKGSTRTGKINQYKSTVFYGEPRTSPVGSWSSGKYRFEYNRFGELDEPTYSTKQIREFITRHPGNLTMIIQKCPSDSARRYPTGSLSLCRFANCPSRLMGYHGKIQPGHYRVSFDEKYAVHGTASDPYLVAFNAHLYCVERFLDFPMLCERFNVQVETRNYAGSEPRSRFSGEMPGKDGDTAQKFIGRCRTGNLARKYPSYPRRQDWDADPYDAHRHTLNRLIQEASHSSKSANRQEFLKQQGSKGSNIVVHMGDVQMQLQSKVDARVEARRAKIYAKQETLTAKRKAIDVSSDSEGDESDESGDSSDDEYYQPPPKRRRR